MTNEERQKIKESILHYLADDWNNHKRGKGHNENVALFDRKDGKCCWTYVDLYDIMDKVVKGIWNVE